MAISEWSDTISIADLQDEPALSDDLATLAERFAAWGESEPPNLVVNFSDISFISSSNIGQLLNLREVLQKCRGTMRLCGLNDEIWSVLMVTNIDKLFDFESDTASALASLQLSG